MSSVGKWILENAFETNEGTLAVDLRLAPIRFRGDRMYRTIAIRLGIRVIDFGG